MKYLAWLTIAACTYLLVIDEGFADDYATIALGQGKSAQNSRVETKFLNVGHREELGLGLTHQYEVGGWIDLAGEGRRSSGYGAYQIGVETDGPLFARIMAGPAIITTTDAYLGGPFQFTEDLYLGLRGPNKNTVGVLYKHISSGGLELPNQGRDFGGVTVSIPF